MSAWKSTQRAFTAATAVGVLCGAPGTSSAVMVDALVTPAGPNFLYELTVTNDTPDDLSIVSIVDAPLAEPLIGASLTAPVDYFAAYDGGLGFIDFVEDLLAFATGTAVSGFSFESSAAPGSFGGFEALTVNGDSLFGQVNFEVIAQAAEPATLICLAIALILLVCVNGRRRLALGFVGAMGTLAAGPLSAASHSDAPLIKQDPQANITDVYAFVGRKFNSPQQTVLNVLVQTRPFSEPGDGVIYDRFADDARYSIHLTHPTTGEEIVRYDFRFSNVNPTQEPGLKNADTILNYGLGSELGPIQTIGGPRQNYTQTYSIIKALANGQQSTLATNLPVPPPNLGPNTTPAYNDPVTGQVISGAVSEAELDELTRQAVVSLGSGEVAFAGPRDDGFYADIPAIFDLLDGRILNDDGNGVDGFKGYNVLVYAMQIPLTDISSVPFINNLLGPGVGIGVFASVSRPRITLRSTSRKPVSRGPWVQVNRMGNPLLNEALIPLRDKDNFNRTKPGVDQSLFAQYVASPELAVLLNAVFATEIVTDGRSDLEAIYIPDVLRVDTTTGPVPLAGQSDFNRRSFFGGDLVVNAEGIPKSGGWPNGRRLGDDVIDIALTALASGPGFQQLMHLGDNVDANDALYNRVFPFAATPHAGTFNRKDPLGVPPPVQ